MLKDQFLLGCVLLVCHPGSLLLLELLAPLQLLVVDHLPPFQELNELVIHLVLHLKYITFMPVIQKTIRITHLQRDCTAKNTTASPCPPTGALSSPQWSPRNLSAPNPSPSALATRFGIVPACPPCSPSPRKRCCIILDILFAQIGCYHVVAVFHLPLPSKSEIKFARRRPLLCKILECRPELATIGCTLTAVRLWGMLLNGYSLIRLIFFSIFFLSRSILRILYSLLFCCSLFSMSWFSSTIFTSSLFR